MKFIGVCGGRDFHDREFVKGILLEHTDAGDAIVHGDAGGADRMAGQFARSWSRFEVSVPAMWDSMGKAAGPRRNAVIAAMPLSLLIAFPGGAGTADMVKQARAKGIEVLEVSPEL